MGWSFSAIGNDRQQCIAALDANTPPSDPDNAEQYQLALTLLKQELERYDGASTGMSINASGSAPGDDGGPRSFTVTITGAAAARTKDETPKAERSDAPLFDESELQPPTKRDR